MTPPLRKWIFETLYKNRYLYRFASTVPFAGQWRVWQRLVLMRIFGHDVLELGCGLGDLLVDMIEAGHSCRAVDQSPQMVEAARDRLQQRNVGEKTWVIHGSAQHLPFTDASFDTVVSTFPSEYIYDPDTIAEVDRVLRPGGRLIVIEGANLLPVGFLQPLLILVQLLVYGPSAVFGPRMVLFSGKGRKSGHCLRARGAKGQKKRHNLASEMEMIRNRDNGDLEDKIVRTNRDTGTGITTDVLPNAWFGQHIPLEQFGLRRRSERVRSRRWEVYITIGEKN